MLAEPLVELLDNVVTAFGHGVAIISYDKRELYAVRVKKILSLIMKEIRLSSNRRNISIATVIL